VVHEDTYLGSAHAWVRFLLVLVVRWRRSVL
jgi:hypothetical protein